MVASQEAAVADLPAVEGMTMGMAASVVAVEVALAAMTISSRGKAEAAMGEPALYFLDHHPEL